MQGSEITVTRRGVEFRLTMQRDGRYFGRSGGVDLCIAQGLLREWIKRGVMTTNEMAEIDREVCEFLGIGQRYTVNDTTGKSLFDSDCESEIHKWIGQKYPDGGTVAYFGYYPAVSTTWEGLKLVVEAIAKCNISWSRGPAGWVCLWDPDQQDGEGRLHLLAETRDGDQPLPMALALAVQQLAKDSK